ncbi:prolipoprotein diacylglyceryl transferase, partial [Thiolapillus sp.]
MIYPEIDPVALSVGPLKIHWYGLMYLVGMLGGWALARWRIRHGKSDWTAQQVDDLLFYCAVGVVLGGRLGYILFYGFNDWLADPTRIFRVWEGGMSFHGGFLGVLTAMW